MLKANELRIGNWVSECPFVEEKHWHHKVDGLSKRWNEKSNKDDIFIHFDNGDLWDENETFCIPITANWLSKFGFIIKDGKYGKDYYSPENFLFVITTRHDGSIGFCWDDFTKEIKFVHQLQNLYFALVGEELVLQD